MDIVQTFYDNLAGQYDKLFLDWNASSKEQAEILNKIFHENGFNKKSEILDCACGIGTQAIGLCKLGYNVTASDISRGELEEARLRAENLNIRFKNADFRELSKSYSEFFDIIIAMDNALPHMLTKNDLELAVRSITNQLTTGGMFVASIRDYDAILVSKPSYSPPYIHQTVNGQRVCFQTWNWNGNHYSFVQYIIDDGTSVFTSKFQCEYRAFTRAELTDMLFACGCKSVEWKFPEETGFYQPIVISKK